MSDKRRGLGRGLGALIPMETSNRARPSDVFFHDQTTRTAPAGEEGDGADDQRGLQEPGKPAASGERTGSTVLRPVPGAEFTELALDDIVPNHRQPREVFDDDELAELAHSIAEIGVLQPVVVRPLENEARGTPGRHAVGGPEALVGARQGTAKYELVMGERRWRASRLAGLDRVPAIVKHTQDEDLLRDALLENLHRSQLNALEEGAAYQQLLQDFGCTHDELAARLGRSRPQISNTIRLLNLPPLVGRRVAAGVLSAGHARALLGLGDGAAMERLAQRIVAEGLSVRATEEIVSSGVDSTAGAPRTRRRVDVDPRLDDLAARMSDRLDTRVTVAMGRRRGKLTVEFASVDDLDRILAALERDRSLLSTVTGHPVP